MKNTVEKRSGSPVASRPKGASTLRCSSADQASTSSPCSGGRFRSRQTMYGRPSVSLFECPLHQPVDVELILPSQPVHQRVRQRPGVEQRVVVIGEAKQRLQLAGGRRAVAVLGVLGQRRLLRFAAAGAGVGASPLLDYVARRGGALELGSVPLGPEGLRAEQVNVELVVRLVRRTKSDGVTDRADPFVLGLPDRVDGRSADQQPPIVTLGTESRGAIGVQAALLVLTTAAAVTRIVSTWGILARLGHGDRLF